VRAIAGQGLAIASAWLLLTLAVFVAGRDVLGLHLAQLQTLGFLTLVFTGQATIYLVRCDGPLWSTPPSGYLVAGTTFAVLAASLMGAYGVLMASVPARVVGALVLAIGAAMLVLDAIKVGVLRISDRGAGARGPRRGAPTTAMDHCRDTGSLPAPPERRPRIRLSMDDDRSRAGPTSTSGLAWPRWRGAWQSGPAIGHGECAQPESTGKSAPAGSLSASALSTAQSRRQPRTRSPPPTGGSGTRPPRSPAAPRRPGRSW
jgi:hypothetical protein